MLFPSTARTIARFSITLLFSIAAAAWCMAATPDAGLDRTSSLVSPAAGSAVPGSSASDPAEPSPAPDLIVIEVEYQPLLIEHDIPVTWKGTSFIIAEWDAATQDQASKFSIPFRVVSRGMTKSRQLYLFELDDHHPSPPPEWLGRVLYRKDNKLVVELTAEDAEGWMNQEFHAVRLSHTGIGWQRAASSFVAFDCTSKPLITSLLGKTSETQWVDWIRKMSGVDQVSIGGTTYTIATRNSPTMFTGAIHAKGYDYLLQQVQSWHYPPANIEEDPFTGTGGQTWKNVILTIPGQTNPGEIVVLSAHYDTTSQMATTLAPGANDNGTGSATVFEAARLLRQYRFGRTIKLIWFTGEEQGLIGSAAYANDHTLTNYLGVLNLDMFGWDSADADRCFEIHVGTLAQSADIGNCFDQSLTSYSLGLTRDYLTSAATDRSDHASFWNHNVGAIEIAENFFTGGPTCSGSDPNAGYHTTSDTLAGNNNTSFGFDIARGALATFAAMAVPIQSCFTSTPSVTLTPVSGHIDLSWTAVPGASTYRVYRSSGGCVGQWFEVNSTAGTTFSDLTATQNQAYYYYVEGVHADGFCTSPPSACQSATPEIIHATNSGRTITDACVSGGPGSGNGVVEPGETLTLSANLQNDGNTALSNITGALTTSTPGVVIFDASASWPNLAAGASSPTLPNHFAIQVPSSMACGTTINLSLLITASEGSWSTPISLLVGTPGSPTTIYTSTDVPKGIIDHGTIQSLLPVSGSGTVTDINVTLSVVHSFDGDLTLTLIHPNSNRVNLSVQNGGNGDNFTNTTFDDEAPTHITSSFPPYSGSFRGDQNLFTLDGFNGNGTWKLEIVDAANGDTGTLTAWSLALRTSAPPVCNVCSSAAGEATNLHWAPGGTTSLSWSAAPNATYHQLYRGTPANLPNLLNGTVDSCTRSLGASLSVPSLSEVPAVGSFYWYLVVGANGNGEGPAGNATGGPRDLDSSGPCP